MPQSDQASLVVPELFRLGILRVTQNFKIKFKGTPLNDTAIRRDSNPIQGGGRPLTKVGGRNAAFTPVLLTLNGSMPPTTLIEKFIAASASTPIAIIANTGVTHGTIA